MSAPSLPLDRVLALRPSNTVARLGEKSKVPVLGARELLSVLPSGIALACLPAYADEAVPALLKASRDEDAALGLSLSWPLAEGDSPSRVVGLVAEEAESVRHKAPLFLQAGPLPYGGVGVGGLTAEVVSLFLDAGFTHFCVDASSVKAKAEATPEALAELLKPVLERGLSVELAPPLADDGEWDPERAQAFLEALVQKGVTPLFVRLPSSAYALREDAREVYELDLSVLEAARAVAQSVGAALSVVQSGRPTARVLRTLCAAGVRKIDVEDPFARAVLQSWPSEAAELLRGEAESQKTAPQRLLRKLAGELQVEVSAAARDRSEATQWADAHDVLAAVGGRGTGSLCVARLAEGRGRP